jgi:hypothetical protein
VAGEDSADERFGLGTSRRTDGVVSHRHGVEAAGKYIASGWLHGRVSIKGVPSA